MNEKGERPILPADVARCAGLGCRAREQCKRYLAGRQPMPGFRTVWARFYERASYGQPGAACDSFMPAEEGR